jgi:polysaccharide chain length determinant protein (PEP-CTERM system associated)
MEIPRTDIQKYLKIVIKRKFLFIVLSLAIMSVIVWGSYFVPKQYEAESTVFIESNVIKNLVGGIAITPSMTDRIRVLRYAMLSRGLISSVLKDLDIDAKTKDARKMEETITSFQERTKISVTGNDLFIVSIRDTDPKLARDYVNTLVRRYVEENVSQKREEAYGANRFLNEQVALFKEKMDRVQDEIIKFRQGKGILMGLDERSVISDIKTYGNELEQIKMRKNELTAVRDKIKKQIKGEEPYTVSVLKRSEGASDANLASLESRLNQLLVRYTENYPEVVKLKAEIEALKKQQAADPSKGPANDSLTEPETSTVNPIYQELRQKLLQAEAEIEALDAKQKQYSAAMRNKEAMLRYIPEEKKKLADMEKQRDSYQSILDQLLLRQGQSEVSKQMEIEDKATTFRIVDPAVFPVKPVNSRIKFILAGIVLGFIGGFGGVFLRENLDTSIKEAKTLRDMGLAVLAVIPKIHNEAEDMAQKKKERLVYAAAGFYFLIICSSLVLELIGLTYIDTMISALKLDALIGSAVHAAKGIF